MQVNRFRGERLSPFHSWIRRMTNSEKIVAGDPNAALRFAGDGIYTSPSEDMPTNPTPGLYAHVNIWEFKTDYDTNTTNTWGEAASGSGTSLVVQDERGGRAKFTNGTSDNNYYSYYSKYEIGRLQANKGLWLKSVFKVADADQCDLFIGLSPKLGSGNIFDNRVDAIGFYMADGSANLNCECRKDSSATQSTGLITVSDATDISVMVHVDGTDTAIFFVDDLSTAGSFGDGETIVTNLPDNEEMSFWFGCRNGQASANTMTIGRTVLVQDE